MAIIICSTSSYFAILRYTSLLPTLVHFGGPFGNGKAAHVLAALNARIVIRVPALLEKALEGKAFQDVGDLLRGEGLNKQSLWLSGVQTRPTIALPPRFAASTDNLQILFSVKVWLLSSCATNAELLRQAAAWISDELYQKAGCTWR